jgi:hypothetical protein
LAVGSGFEEYWDNPIGLSDVLVNRKCQWVKGFFIQEAHKNVYLT